MTTSIALPNIVPAAAPRTAAPAGGLGADAVASLLTQATRASSASWSTDVSPRGALVFTSNPMSAGGKRGTIEAQPGAKGGHTVSLVMPGKRYPLAEGQPATALYQQLLLTVATKAPLTAGERQGLERLALHSRNWVQQPKGTDRRAAPMNGPRETNRYYSLQPGTELGVRHGRLWLQLSRGLVHETILTFVTTGATHSLELTAAQEKALSAAVSGRDRDDSSFTA